MGGCGQGAKRRRVPRSFRPHKYALSTYQYTDLKYFTIGVGYYQQEYFPAAADFLREIGHAPHQLHKVRECVGTPLPIAWRVETHQEASRTVASGGMKYDYLQFKKK